jgi:hypothetical protein
LFPSTQMGFAKLTLSWDKEWHSDMHPDCAPWLLAIALRRLCYSPYLVASLIGIARCCKIRAPLTYAEWGMLHYSQGHIRLVTELNLICFYHRMYTAVEATIACPDQAFVALLDACSSLDIGYYVPWASFLVG